MPGTILRISAVLSCGVLGLVGWSGLADGQGDAKGKLELSGTWVLQGGQMKIEFAKKDVMKLFPHGDQEVVAILCQFTVENKGLVKAKITGFDGKEELQQHMKERLPAGSEFTFQWTVTADTATVADVKGAQAELFKSHMEGKYDKKK